MCLAHTLDEVRSQAEEDGLPTVSRRRFLLGGAAAAVAAALPAPALAQRRPRRGNRLLDLTHDFRAGFPVYTDENPRRRTTRTIEKDGFYSQEWTFHEHSGTHMDAPGHFVPGGRLADKIALRRLLVPAVVIDISRRVAANPDAAVTRKDLLGFERREGRIPRGAAVFMYSGWERRVGDQTAYRNPGPDGKFHFPGFGIDAVRWLLENRDITCIGVDTLSLDIGASTTFEVHKTLLGADRYGLENLANLKGIPPAGSTVFVGLIPWEAGSGGPCRVIARF